MPSKPNPIVHKAAVLGCGMLAAVSLLAQSLEPVRKPDASPQLANAQVLFADGQFAQAEAADALLPDVDKYSIAGLQLRAQLQLAANHLSAAEGDLLQARRLDMHNRVTLQLLGLAYWRQDRFADAAPFLAQADDIAEARVAQSLAGHAAYRLEGLGILNRIRLIRTTPLPVVAVRLNAGDVRYFTVDTGAAEVTIDPAVAAQLDLPDMGRPAFATTAQSNTQTHRSILPALAVGVWTVHDVPVLVGPTAPDAPATASDSVSAQSQLRIDGVLGAEFLTQFVTTLDVPHAELQLGRLPGLAGAETDAGRHQRLLGQGAVPATMHWVGFHSLLADYGAATPRLVDSAAGEQVTVPHSAEGVRIGGLLGQSLFDKHRVTLDTGNMFLWVEK